MPGTARSIEPEFNQVTIACRQFFQIREVVLVVSLGVCISGVVPVPWRKVDAKLEAKLTRRAGHVADHVAFAIFPGTGFNAVVCLFGRPKTKAVMMFGYQHNIL